MKIQNKADFAGVSREEAKIAATKKLELIERLRNEEWERLVSEEMKRRKYPFFIFWRKETKSREDAERLLDFDKFMIFNDYYSFEELIAEQVLTSCQISKEDEIYLCKETLWSLANCWPKE